MKNFTSTDPTQLREQAEQRLRGVCERINSQLYAVEDRIHAQARAFDPAVADYVRYVTSSQGKRLRSALTLFAAEATGPVSPAHVDLAVILELIHLASLVHDDIMDGAELRRARLTANAKWGSAISVLLGDCLFAHALTLATGFDDREVTKRIAASANEVCSGEILQTQRRFDLSLSLSEYFRIIEMKTAALFGSATELAGLINKASPREIVALKNFGLKLGSAYQIYDDCVDLAGSEDDAGKSLGTDFEKGKLTLPVLLLLQQHSGKELEKLHSMILHGTEDHFQKVATLARDTGTLAGAARTARQMIRQASEDMSWLPDGVGKDSLLAIGESVIDLLRQFE
ncbi:MAG: polyprenyl synthetase family protein [Verrucomicrobiales bacterium]